MVTRPRCETLFAAVTPPRSRNADREGAAGDMSHAEGVLTVREMPENLDRIAEVLATYDRAPAAVTLNFQLIEANGFSGRNDAFAVLHEQHAEALNRALREEMRRDDKIFHLSTEPPPQLLEEFGDEQAEWNPELGEPINQMALFGVMCTFSVVGLQSLEQRHTRRSRLAPGHRENRTTRSVNYGSAASLRKAARACRIRWSCLCMPHSRSVPACRTASVSARTRA